MNDNSPIEAAGVARQIIEGLVSSVPNILKALVVFIIGYIIAKLIAKLVLKGLQKAGIDRLKDKLDEIEIFSKSNLSFLPSSVISKSFYYLILLTVIITAVDILQIDAITDLLKEFMVLLPNLFVAVIILIIGLLVAEAIRTIVQSTCNSLGIPAAKVISTFVFFFVIINALMIALKKATIPIQFLTDNLTLLFGGIVAAFAIGYGLASKGIMSSFLSSYYSKSRYNLGDTITIDGSHGEIVEMDSTTIVIHGKEGRTVVPLSKFTEEKVIIHNA
jgi:hypothetical protein